MVLSGVTQEQDGLLAGGQHIAPRPLSAPADSPLYPEVLAEQGAELARRTNNFTIEFKLGVKSCKNDDSTLNPAHNLNVDLFIYFFSIE